jgi:putative peptide zinc metalloprotease protein
MFSRIKPTLASLLPWRKANERVTELKPWVRVAVTAYVLTVVPLLLFLVGLMVINAPRIFSTAYDSLVVQYHKVEHAFDGGSAWVGAFGLVQILILLLPALGIVATFWLAFRRSAGAVWARTEEQPAGRVAYVLAISAIAAFLAYIWWPNGEYRPIQPGEKGTIQGAIQQLGKVSSGRPGLPEERARELGGAPLLSSQTEQTEPREPQPRTPTESTPTTTAESPTTTATTTATTTTTATP